MRLWSDRFDIHPEEREAYDRERMESNLRRGRIMALSIIGYESVLLATDVITAAMRLDARFHFSAYFVMYALMIGMNVAFLHVFSPRRRVRSPEWEENAFLGYTVLMLSWGSVLTLMDQKLYGQLTAYLVLLITASVLYHFDGGKNLIPFVVSLFILCVGLPFYQHSMDVLIGHYVNLAVFAITSWVASRVASRGFADQFASHARLIVVNRQLEEEIEENRDINLRLEAANRQLVRAARLDELTGIPNRRGFRTRLESLFDAVEANDASLSVIMLDIDYFKQYNDGYGHDAGDRVLVAVARLLETLANGAGACCCRWGGEEFVLASFTLDEAGIAALAEDIRRMVFDMEMENRYAPKGDRISVSLGTCILTHALPDDIRQAVGLADKAMYLAKAQGRNRMTAAVTQPAASPAE